MTFREAKAAYAHRYTLEHIPGWAKKPCNNGKYYAPHYRTDKEWFDNTKFPPDPMCYGSDCYSSGKTWPLGEWLDEPYTKTKQGGK